TPRSVKPAQTAQPSKHSWKPLGDHDKASTTHSAAPAKHHTAQRPVNTGGAFSMPETLGDRMTAHRLNHIQPLIAPNVDPRVVTLDIERIPGRARVKHRGLTIEGEFWDLNGWKHTIGRRIHPDDVTEWPRTICAAWRWYGEE